jgi:hypothetical protein
MPPDYRSKYFDLKMLVKQLRIHERSSMEKSQVFIDWLMKKRELQKLVDNVVFQKEVLDADNQKSDWQI